MGDASDRQRPEWVLAQHIVDDGPQKASDSDVHQLAVEVLRLRDLAYVKYELLQAEKGYDVLGDLTGRIDKLYMALNAKARGDENDLDGDPATPWNRLVELSAVTLARLLAAERWAALEHRAADRCRALLTEHGLEVSEPLPSPKSEDPPMTTDPEQADTAPPLYPDGMPEWLYDDIESEIHQHCGHDGQSDEANDWVTDLMSALTPHILRFAADEAATPGRQRDAVYDRIGRLEDQRDRLTATADRLRRQRDEARDNHQSALDEQVRLERELLRTRRQRDERPAGRVVRRFVIGTDQRILARVDEPPGTEVAVVVVATKSRS